MFLRKMIGYFYFTLIVFILSLVIGCQKSKDGAQGPQGYGVGVFSDPATASQCQAGGAILHFFQDINNNGIYDSNDNVTNIVAVCNGLSGLDGSNSSISVTQATVAQCAAGGFVFTSQTGGLSTTNKVCNGTTGPQGQQGPAGTDIASVSVVQFCTGYTTSYPGTFPEYGICIANKIYGVYWDHTNSWLAEVVPGAYNSTSTTAPCSFTVASGCLISH